MRHIALLRGVNVGSRTLVAMAKLRALFVELGHDDARTVLQSGNVVFSASGAIAALERRLEAAIAEAFGRPVAVMLRSAREWDRIVTANPFTAEAKRDPGHVVVLCLKRAPGARAATALQAAIAGRETVQVRGRNAYIHYPDGIGRSKLTNAMIEGKLATAATGRNWNTVLKLQAATRD